MTDHAAGMDDAGELAPMQLRRAGTPWREDDVQELIDALRNGYPMDEIAHQLERTEERSSRWPPGWCRRRTRRSRRGDASAPPGCVTSCPAMAVTTTGARRTRPTTPTNCRPEPASRSCVRRGNRSPDVDCLADQLGVTVRRLVREFIELGLGHGIEDVVDRLGCSPDGQARKLLDLILHNRAYTAFVLLVVDGEGRLVHVSVHHEQLLAEAARDRVLPALAREVALQGREVTDLKPRIVPRLLDATDPLTTQ